MSNCMLDLNVEQYMIMQDFKKKWNIVNRFHKMTHSECILLQDTS